VTPHPDNASQIGPNFMPCGRWELVVGPPGTGKTSTLLSHLEEELISGVAAEEIAYVSFTRAARIEAASRASETLGCGPDRFVWCRTIHSTAYRLLGLRPEEVLNSKDLREFGQAYGYDFRGARVLDDEEDEIAGSRIMTDDDKLFAVLEWARSRMLPAAEALRRGPYDVASDEYSLFLARYAKFKEEKARLDFYDMLEECLALHLRPPVIRAIVDEAQDLSPLQVQLVQRWFMDCERVYIAGDDDQAIYGFSGADSRWVLALADRFPTRVLTQSYRVPRLPYELAKKIIIQNRARVKKSYLPKPTEGSVDVLERRDIIGEIDENQSTFILGRHWRGVREFARLLRDKGIAFTVEKHPTLSPLGATAALQAYRAARALQEGRSIAGTAFLALLKQIPSGKHGGRLLPRGAKKEAKERRADVVTLDSLRLQGLQLLVDALLSYGPRVLSRVPMDLLAAFEALEKRYGKVPLKPHVRAMSMHASKGREADTVVILPELSRAAYRDYTTGGQAAFEAENRVAYVATTRTKNRLLIARSEEERTYPYSGYASEVVPKSVDEKDENDWWFG